MIDRRCRVVFLRNEAITMATVSIDEAQTRLSEIVHQLAPGDEVIITENDKPVATLYGVSRVW
jgi:antitoxin (DNA-binding transcriptional repressor) of toxin-antitoxin stability system